MAKDGTRRGGARAGAGRKPKALTDKINEGISATIIELPETPTMEGVDVPPVKDYLKTKQKSGKDLCAAEVFEETWKWLKARGCDRLVSTQLVEQYAMSVSRWIQCEECISEYGFLDGSPPCSVFSDAGAREKGWGTEKTFREGQKKQRLDDLFLHFIHTAEILKPKIIIAENVKGLVAGNAKGYVNEIIKAFKSAGYSVQIFLLDAQTMGVPQRRKRVFFIARRNDLNLPKLVLDFREKPIHFGEVRSAHGIPLKECMMASMIKKRKPGDKCFSDISERERGKRSMFNDRIVEDHVIAPTNTSGGMHVRYVDGEKFSDADYIATQTFPQDYDFGKESVQYVCGMSVPPVMMANIASAVYEQWLKGGAGDEETEKV